MRSGNGNGTSWDTDQTDKPVAVGLRNLAKEDLLRDRGEDDDRAADYADRLALAIEADRRKLWCDVFLMELPRSNVTPATGAVGGSTNLIDAYRVTVVASAGINTQSDVSGESFRHSDAASRADDAMSKFDQRFCG